MSQAPPPNALPFSLLFEKRGGTLNQYHCHSHSRPTLLPKTSTLRRFGSVASFVDREGGGDYDEGERETTLVVRIVVVVY